MAARSGDILVLKPAFSPELDRKGLPQNCELRIKIAERSASVVSETGCAGYHGAGASFVEQAGDLQLVTGA